MPRLIITEGAGRGLERCRQFLALKSPQASRRAAQTIEQQLMRLETMPDMGRPLSEQPELRELVIGFGNSGYRALYRYEPDQDKVYLLAFRHQREAGY
ncbi:MAG: type II toxin-antitoxin system RelE/ParE family toxin [Candidatus Thiodiazotropha sp. (ex Epidulcina cf. delphinae)]|nr:type II toxin-antitoxin system RelE/ParE family toxin [Candidatus Thiodiazotropha sp. (ex Epidulcina cf. delphinae)]